MKKLVIASLSLVLVACVFGVANAQQGPGGRGMRRGGDMVLRMADADADGKVTEKEWVAIFKKIDTSGDGVLSEEEIEKFREVAAEEARKAMFGRMDSNSDGVLTKDEFGGREGMFSRVDANSDGKVTPEELNNAWGNRGDGGRRRGDSSESSTDSKDKE